MEQKVSQVGQVFNNVVEQVKDAGNPFVRLVVSATADNGEEMVSFYKADEVKEAAFQSQNACETIHKALSQRLDSSHHIVIHKTLGLIRVLILEGPPQFRNLMLQITGKIRNVANYRNLHSDEFIPKDSIVNESMTLAEAVLAAITGDTAPLVSYQYAGSGSNGVRPAAGARGGAEAGGVGKSEFQLTQEMQLKAFRKRREEEYKARHGTVVAQRVAETFTATNPKKLTDFAVNHPKKKFTTEELENFVEAAEETGQPETVCSELDKILRDGKTPLQTRYKALSLADSLLRNLPQGYQFFLQHHLGIYRHVNFEQGDNPTKSGLVQQLAVNMMEVVHGKVKVPATEEMERMAEAARQRDIAAAAEVAAQRERYQQQQAEMQNQFAKLKELSEQERSNPPASGNNNNDSNSSASNDGWGDEGWASTGWGNDDGAGWGASGDDTSTVTGGTTSAPAPVPAAAPATTPPPAAAPAASVPPAIPAGGAAPATDSAAAMMQQIQAVQQQMAAMMNSFQGGGASPAPTPAVAIPGISSSNTPSTSQSSPPAPLPLPAVAPPPPSQQPKPSTSGGSDDLSTLRNDDNADDDDEDSDDKDGGYSPPGLDIANKNAESEQEHDKQKDANDNASKDNDDDDEDDDEHSVSGSTSKNKNTEEAEKGNMKTPDNEDEDDKEEPMDTKKADEESDAATKEAEEDSWSGKAGDLANEDDDDEKDDSAYSPPKANEEHNDDTDDNNEGWPENDATTTGTSAVSQHADPAAGGLSDRQQRQMALLNQLQAMMTSTQSLLQQQQGLFVQLQSQVMKETTQQ